MEIPEDLKPAATEETVEVPVVPEPYDVVIKNFKAGDLAMVSRMAEVTPDVMATLAKLGIQGEGIGIIKISTGATLLTQQALLEAISKISYIMSDPKTSDEKKLKAAYPLGYLADRLTKAASVAVEIQGGPQAPVPVGGPVKRNKSFLPGQAVQMTGPVTINVANSEKTS